MIIYERYIRNKEHIFKDFILLFVLKLILSRHCYMAQFVIKQKNPLCFDSMGSKFQLCDLARIFNTIHFSVLFWLKCSKRTSMIMISTSEPCPIIARILVTKGKKGEHGTPLIIPRHGRCSLSNSIKQLMPKKLIHFPTRKKPNGTL